MLGSVRVFSPGMKIEEAAEKEVKGEAGRGRGGVGDGGGDGREGQGWEEAQSGREGGVEE